MLLSTSPAGNASDINPGPGPTKRAPVIVDSGLGLTKSRPTTSRRDQQTNKKPLFHHSLFSSDENRGFLYPPAFSVESYLEEFFPFVGERETMNGRTPRTEGARMS